MLVHFGSMKAHSRVWIYHSKRKFTPEEIAIISESLESFTSDWKAHGTPLLASFVVRLDQFIVLAVDEEAHGASGCSIDGSTRAMKQLEQRLGFDLFERAQASFVTEDGVVTLPLKKLKEAADAGQWNAETPSVNTLVATIAELDHAFIVPAGSTWLKRYLPTSPVTG